MGDVVTLDDVGGPVLEDTHGLAFREDVGVFASMELPAGLGLGPRSRHAAAVLLGALLIHATAQFIACGDMVLVRVYGVIIADTD